MVNCQKRGSWEGIGIKDMLMFGPEKLDECEFYSLKYGTWKEKQLWGQKN